MTMTKQENPILREGREVMQASGNFHCDEHNRTAEQKTELHRTTMTIGGAVYQITRHYRDSGAAAVTDKLIRLMEKELRSAH